MTAMERVTEWCMGVACPSCGAAAGEPCRRGENLTRYVHAKRRQAALEAGRAGP